MPKRPVRVSSGAGPPTPSGRRRALYRMRPRRRRSVQGLPYDRVSRQIHKDPSRPPKKICRLTIRLPGASDALRSPAASAPEASIPEVAAWAAAGGLRVALPPLALRGTRASSPARSTPRAADRVATRHRQLRWPASTGVQAVSGSAATRGEGRQSPAADPSSVRDDVRSNRASHPGVPRRDDRLASRGRVVGALAGDGGRAAAVGGAAAARRRP